MTDIQTADGEWSILQDADVLGRDVKELLLEADDVQMEAVRARLGVERVSGLKAQFRFDKTRGVVIHVRGKVFAQVVQNCVVSLDPISIDIAEPIEAWFVDSNEAILLDKKRKERELQMEEGQVPLLDEKDDPEAIIDGQIDLGELAVQFLSLAIDPYPHADGAEHTLTDANTKPEDFAVKKNPFEALKNWKGKQGD